MEGDQAADNYSSNSYSEKVEQANDLLLYRRFKECTAFCVHHSKEFGNHFEDARAVKACEALCIVAIQAFAEQNCWQQVLPYVTQLYDGLEKSPQPVVQLCLLLHVEINDHTTCAAIATVWLRDPDNFHKPGYRKIVEIFIASSLVPNNRWDDIESFVNGCPGLEVQTCELIMKTVKRLRHRSEQDNINKITVMPDNQVAEKEIRLTEKLQPALAVQWSICKRWLLTLHNCRPLTPSVLRRLRNGLACVIILYIIITRFHTGRLIKAHLHTSGLYFLQICRQILK